MDPCGTTSPAAQSCTGGPPVPHWICELKKFALALLRLSNLMDENSARICVRDSNLGLTILRILGDNPSIQ